MLTILPALGSKGQKPRLSARWLSSGIPAACWLDGWTAGFLLKGGGVVKSP